MPDDPNLPAADPIEPRRPTRTTCEFCGCTLTPSGEILKMSDEARGHRDRKEELEKLSRQIAKLETDLAEAKRRLEPAASTSERGLLLR